MRSLGEILRKRRSLEKAEDASSMATRAAIEGDWSWRSGSVEKERKMLAGDKLWTDWRACGVGKSRIKARLPLSARGSGRSGEKKGSDKLGRAELVPPLIALCKGPEIAEKPPRRLHLLSAQPPAVPEQDAGSSRSSVRRSVDSVLHGRPSSTLPWLVQRRRTRAYQRRSRDVMCEEEEVR